MPIRLIVGLGNPGARYQRNRHNIGFMAADEIHRRQGFGPFRAKFESALAEGSIAGERVYLQKPETYMNASGDAVGAAQRFYKIDPSEIAVIYDEIDLAPGKLRVKQGGGSAGHNGIRSLEAAIGEDFWRVRLGVGHPGDKRLVEPYVLQNFDAEEMIWGTPLVNALAEALPLLVAGNASGFMTKVALILKPPTPRPPRAAEEKENKD